jgi:hypothetical protein
MTFEEIKEAILDIKPQLSSEEREYLIGLLRISERTEAEIGDTDATHSVLELVGLGAEIWEGIDAQDYVNQLRSEWDERGY